ncbi:MAG TPA: LysM peptidoglycan-binding domain-containing protein [Bacteroidales bacterium]|nr:LysM peptidoglycan-binding domain-containing protein [Bacteroidales bacterium]
MRFINWIKVFPVFIILLIFSIPVDSQVVVERSKNKVVISGVPYFIHQVKKGETAYSIARAYGITVEELTRQNPPAVYGVNEGQSLRIPVEMVNESKPLVNQIVVNKVHDDSKFIYHVLKPGETVYSLSKSFGVSENEIIQSNPGIDITKLSVGVELAIPRREFMNDQQKFDTEASKYIYHKVLMGETLSSIAKQYGLSVRQLRKENRDLRFPQVGDFVRIPGAKIAEKQDVEQIKNDTITPVAEEAPLKIERSAEFTTVKDLKGSMDVEILLPFYLSENKRRIEIDSSRYLKGKKIKVTNVAEDWIYPASMDFLEMYEGILLASDTLRTLGLNINLHAYDIDSDTVEITKLIKSGILAKMNLIIGPVYSHNLAIVSEYTRSLGIPVVSPVPLMNNYALLNNPTLFMASAPLEVAQKALAKEISKYYDDNIVFIHTDTAGVDEDVKKFKKLIFSELIYKIPYEEIKFKEFPFYSRAMFNNDSINRLSHSLSETSKNVVVIASEEAPVVSEVIDNVSGLYRKYDIQVFGYPVIRDLDKLDQKELFDLGIMIYSPFWIDYSKLNVKKFNLNFRNKFHTQPLERSYAWQGYDITYYFLSGLAMHGNKFIAHPEIHYPELLQNDFDFIRNGPGNGFENQKLFKIRYTKDYRVILEDENQPPQ